MTAKVQAVLQQAEVLAAKGNLMAIKLGLSEIYLTNVYVKSADHDAPFSIGLNFAYSRTPNFRVYIARDGIIFEPIENYSTWKKTASVGLVIGGLATGLLGAAASGVIYAGIKIKDANTKSDYLSDIASILSHLQKSIKDVIIADVKNGKVNVYKKSFSFLTMSFEPRKICFSGSISVFEKKMTNQNLWWISHGSIDGLIKTFSSIGLDVFAE